MQDFSWIITIILIAAGFLGGTTNFLLLYDPRLEKSNKWIKYWTSVLLSLCASLTVPLFLQILSNNLLDTVNFKNSLIFVGFCVLASFFSKRFLDDLYQKVKNLESKVDKSDTEIKKELKESVTFTETVNKKVEDLEESIEESEIEALPGEIKHALLSNGRLSVSEIEAEKIVKALLTSNYSLRTINGISKEAEVLPEKVAILMDHLRDFGFAESKVGHNGKDFWRILKQPIKIYSASYGLPGNYIDVTAKLRDLVALGKFTGLASQAFFNIQDPAPGVPKLLKIHCRIHGKETERVFNEGDTFNLE